MNKFAIPAILAATVMVAGMFAFMPVEQASTVHTTSGNSAIQEVVSVVPAAADNDIRITCPETASGCHILEIYIQETASQAVRIDTISAEINGIAIATLVDNADLTVNNAVALLPEAGGIALGPGDFIELNTDAGATSNTSVYTARIIAEVGNGVAMETSSVT